MSRLGKKPINVPEGVTLVTRGDAFVISGPRGTLEIPIPRGFTIVQEDAYVRISPRSPSAPSSADIALQYQRPPSPQSLETKTKESARVWGTLRALVANGIEGVTKGVIRKLELEGIGYQARTEDGTLVLRIGFSHPVVFPAPSGITFGVERNVITVQGIDKQLVGRVTASIRAVRKPEPYKGKGIRYQGEVIRRKAGKKAAGAA